MSASLQDIKEAQGLERKEYEERAEQGETVVKSGKGGNSLEAQVHLAEGRSKGGHTRAGELGMEGYKAMGQKGGLSTNEKSGGEAASEQRIELDASLFTK